MIDRDPDLSDSEQAGALLVRVRSPSLEVFLEDFSVWITTSGMLVRTDDSPPVDTPVRLDLRVDDDWKLIQGAGRVSWVRSEAAEEGEPAGFGIEFANLSAQSRKLLSWIETDRTASRAEGVEPKASASPRSRLEIVPLDGTEPPLGRDGWKERSWVSKVLVGAGLAVLSALLVGGGLLFFRREEPAPGPGTSEARALATSGADPALVGETVHEVVQAWADAWETRSASRHVATYAGEFVPPSGMSRAEWEAWRTVQIEQPEDIRIGVEVLEIEQVDEDWAIVAFEQVYETDTSENLVVKELSLVRRDGRWSIVEERVVEPR